MIKVIIGEQKTQSESIDYPCLMQSMISGNIVLFHKESHGIVLKIKGKRGGYTVGDYKTSLLMGNFKPITEPITLQNA
jgi:hypothetical protein